MNSAPESTNSAATETSDEIRNSALCTALRAITVSSAAKIAASAKIQKKIASGPDKIIVECANYRDFLSVFSVLSVAYLSGKHVSHRLHGSKIVSGLACVLNRFPALL